MQNEKEKINPFDILSGKVVKTEDGFIFWFKEAGNNFHINGYPIHKYLHNLNGPAVSNGFYEEFWINGVKIPANSFRKMICKMKKKK